MDQLFPSALFTNHMGKWNGKGLSPRLWSRISSQPLATDGQASAYSKFDHFMNFYPVTLTTAAGQLQPGEGYFVYNEVGTTVGSIKPDPTYTGGVLKLLTSTAAAAGADHDIILTTQGNVGTQCVVSNTAGADKPLIFEARFRLPSVADNYGSFFVGLTEEGCGAANGVITGTTTHSLADKDSIGFLITKADGDSLKFGYKKAGQTAQTVLSYGTALTADTWYNVGFVYDPAEVAAKRIKVFVNNVEQSTYVTADNIAAATFPNGEELTFTAAAKARVNNSAIHMLLDFWGLWQAQ